MPLTDKGRKILANMKKQYGDKEGESVFYASAKKGTITGVEESLVKRVSRKLKKVFKKR